ncbi:carbohydrate-binding domain-containing protein, partial [Candidatus Seribacter sulfatis]|uniref:carbohydrate-binding domain-containing protein n=1 Tax=Candidatus Seribacter sulfatis TaxID=3381756 RepID=UPI00389B31CB
VVIGNQGDDDLHFGDITIEEFSENWQVLDSEGNAKDLKEMTVDGKIDLALIKGSGTIVGPDGSEIAVKSLETLSFEEEITPPPTPSSVDGLVHDGKITVTLGGEAFKGNPEYAILVDGKEVSRGEVTWSHDTTGTADRYADIEGTGREGNTHGGVGDIDNDQVTWKNVSLDYDFSNGMPQTVEVKFLNDAWGGSAHDDDDRNLIVDNISVDGLKIESEGEFTTYGNREGMERMSWQGGMEYNVNQAYANQVDEHNAKALEVPSSTDKESNMERVTIGEPTEIFSSSFEDKLQGGIQGNPSYFMAEVDGWQSSSESIEIWSDEMNRDLGSLPDGKTSAAAGDQFIELNDVKSNAFKDAAGIYREVATEAGKVYEVTFDYSGRPGYDASVNTFEVKVGDTQLGTYNQDMSQAKEHDWQKVTVEFVGTGEPMKIQFQENSDSDHNYGRGISLDNIILVDTGVEERLKTEVNSNESTDSKHSQTDDITQGGKGSDVLKGGQGDDILKGGKGNDVLKGGQGDDILKGGKGSDVLKGGQGDDILKGGKGSDVLRGGQGDDILKGGKGSDVLKGGQGDDILQGGKGSDVLKGGDGDDTLIGDSATETKEPTGVPIGENLIVNGSFENHGDLNRGSWGTFDKIEGWQSAEGSIEIQEGKHGGTPGAAEGDSVLELDAHNGRDTNASVFQDIRTGTDGTFKLSFSFSAREIGNAANTSASNTTEVYWGGEKIATLSADQKGWNTHEFDLSVNPESNDTTRLEFRGTGTDDGVGGLIDNVSVMRIL